jgi:hypothetical protein
MARLRELAAPARRVQVLLESHRPQA